MTWIKTLDYDQSEGKLRQIYERVKGPENHIDNILMAHSLRPHTLEGHMAIYKTVLHHSGNRLDKSLLEMLGVYVSLLNKCAYCVDHHFSGLRRLLGDDKRADQIRNALEHEEFDDVFNEREQTMLRYAKSLTTFPHAVKRQNIDALRQVGLDDGEILEINQVVAYFAYANRTVLGLGVTTEGDQLGLSPGDSEQPENWSHK